MNKQEFIDEIASRGPVDLDSIPEGFVYDQWCKVGFLLHYYSSSSPKYAVDASFYFNPPTSVSDIHFWEYPTQQEELPTDWLLARLNELPFTQPQTTVTVAFTTKKEDGSELTGTSVYIDGALEGTT